MEREPKYAKINEEELREMEAEFGGPLSEELALWFIRNRIQREAVERMIGVRGEEPCQRLRERVRKIGDRADKSEHGAVARKCA